MTELSELKAIRKTLNKILKVLLMPYKMPDKLEEPEK